VGKADWKRTRSETSRSGRVSKYAQKEAARAIERLKPQLAPKAEPQPPPEPQRAHPVRRAQASVGQPLVGQTQILSGKITKVEASYAFATEPGKDRRNGRIFIPEKLLTPALIEGATVECEVMQGEPVGHRAIKILSITPPA
jgi:hypothetical protein